MKRRRFVRMKLVSIPSSPSTRRMVRTPSYYIHLPHHRSQILRTTVLLPTAPPSPPTQVSEYNQNQSTSIHPPPQTSPHVTQYTPPTSPPLTHKQTSSGHPRPQTHSPQTKHINSITYISTIPSFTRCMATSLTAPAFPHPSPSSQRRTSHLK